MLVSVIMPIHNGASCLRECLDSVVAQMFRDFEILCVDDGSTDDTASILAEYAKIDPRIRVITQEARGAGAARNRGLQEARGEYLSILDADDIFAPTMLEDAVARAEQTKADVVVYRHEKLDQRTGERVPLPRTSTPDMFPDTDVFSIDDLRQVKGRIWLRAVFGWTWDKLFRRAFVEKLGVTFQVQPIFNDMFFTYAVMAEAQRIAYLPKVLMAQRINRSSSVSNKVDAFWPFLVTSLYRLRERFLERHLDRMLPDLAAYSLYIMVHTLDKMSEETRRRAFQAYEDLAFRLLGIDLARKEIPFSARDLSIWRRYEKVFHTASHHALCGKSSRSPFRRMIQCYHDTGPWYTLKRLLALGR